MGQTGHIPVALVDLSSAFVASRDCDGLSLLATLGTDHEELALSAIDMIGELFLGSINLGLHLLLELRSGLLLGLRNGLLLSLLPGDTVGLSLVGGSLRGLLLSNTVDLGLLGLLLGDTVGQFLGSLLLGNAFGLGLLLGDAFRLGLLLGDASGFLSFLALAVSLGLSGLLLGDAFGLSLLLSSSLLLGCLASCLDAALFGLRRSLLVGGSLDSCGLLVEHRCEAALQLNAVNKRAAASVVSVDAVARATVEFVRATTIATHARELVDIYASTDTDVGRGELLPAMSTTTIATASGEHGAITAPELELHAPAMSVKTAGIDTLDGELVARDCRLEPVTTGRMGQTGHIPVALVDLSSAFVASRDCDGLSLLATLGTDHEELALSAIDMIGELFLGSINLGLHLLLELRSGLLLGLRNGLLLSLLPGDTVGLSLVGGSLLGLLLGDTSGFLSFLALALSLGLAFGL